MLQRKWFIWLLWQVSVTRVITGEDIHFTEFINEVEHLVLNTTDEALRMTTIIYQNLTATMPDHLREATKPLMDNYLEMVNNTLPAHHHNEYEDKRILLRYFRINNWKIERLRLKFAPHSAAFQFQVISREFYFGGRNTTIFDNLYLKFMAGFQRACEKLWSNLSEEVVETQQELLEILDEISKEMNLAEKDKLYDEFIEMFLFKSPQDRVETRELE